MALNGGDAAILQALLQTLERIFGKHTEVVVYERQPEAASKYYPKIEFRQSLYFCFGSQRVRRLFYKLRLGSIAYPVDLVRFYVGVFLMKHNLKAVAGSLFLTREEIDALEDYISADLVVSTGGTYLVENYNLNPRIFDYKITLYFKRPLIFFTQSLGPFSVTSNRKALKRIFEKALLILLRDQESLENLLDLKPKVVNANVVSDSAFALANIKAINATKTDSNYYNTSPKVAISVRAWKHFKSVDPVLGEQRYVEALQALTIYLVEKYNAEIVYISTCQGIPEYQTDDSQMAMKIVEPLPEMIKKSIKINREFHAPEDFMKMVQKCDVMVATRMHAAILALGAGTPVLPIAYEFKITELFNRLGQGQWTQNIENICKETLINSMEMFLKSLPESRKTLFAAVEQERNQALLSGMMIEKEFVRWRRVENREKSIGSSMFTNG